MRLSLFLIALVSVGCNERETRSEYWDGYRYYIMVRPPGDDRNLADQIEGVINHNGFTKIERPENADLPHAQALETLVVSFDYVAAAKCHLSVRMRDYTTGYILHDPVADKDLEKRPINTFSDSNAGFSSRDVKLTELVQSFDKFLGEHHKCFNKDAVLLRPRWITNEERHVGND